MVGQVAWAHSDGLSEPHPQTWSTASWNAASPNCCLIAADYPGTRVEIGSDARMHSFELPSIRRDRQASPPRWSCLQLPAMEGSANKIK